jgi:CheY-like chemotaxis protein
MTDKRIEPVLIVDDTPAVARIVRMLLSNSGVQDIDLAPSGPEAIRRLGQKRYRLVMCKRAMQPLNAFDLRQIMASRDAWAGIPFIILSQEKDGDAEKLRQFERTHILPVPFGADTLRSTIERAMGFAAV